MLTGTGLWLYQDEASLQQLGYLLHQVARGELSPQVAAEQLGLAPGGEAERGVVAVVPIRGVLMQRGGWLGNGYDALADTMDALAADPEVRSIVLDVDSPGGTVYGIDNAGRAIREASKRKRVVGVANSMAASAAYWLLSQAGEVVVAPQGDVGSIGVYILHLELSKLLEDIGIQATVVREPERKADINIVEPLSKDARGWMEARVHDSYQRLLATVAEARGTTPENVAATYGQGRLVEADQAVALGLADRVGTLRQVVAELVTEPDRAQRMQAAEREKWRERLALMKMQAGPVDQTAVRE